MVQDAFDLAALRAVLQRVSSRGCCRCTSCETATPSPFAQSLQFGFVMDWLYADDAPRAESRAALLSLDRVLLDELLGGDGADAGTLAALELVLDERRGTAPGRQARDADELSVLVDRAGDLTGPELRLRVAPEAEWRRGDPVHDLLDAGRMMQVTIAGESRFILADAAATYAAAFGDEVVAPLVPGGELTPDAARREVVGRFAALASPFTVADVTARYGLGTPWVQQRLEQWEARGRLARGAFGGDRSVSRWCSRRALERARRRELAAARAQVQPVDLAAFAAFMQRWQHLTSEARLAGADATATALRQLQGIARPGAAGSATTCRRASPGTSRRCSTP